MSVGGASEVTEQRSSCLVFQQWWKVPNRNSGRPFPPGVSLDHRSLRQRRDHFGRQLALAVDPHLGLQICGEGLQARRP